MRYVVVGVGRQGLAAVYDLVKHCQATDVLAIDIRFADKAVLQETQEQLRDLLGDQADGVRLVGTDLSTAASLNQLAAQVAGYDCILSALPYALNVYMSEVAIAVAVPMCDMGGNPEVVERQMTLAKQHGHILVPECGLAPGIANLLIKYLQEHRSAKLVKTYCGGLPSEKPDAAENPLQFKLLFSPAGLISEYMGMCPILRGGRLAYEPALSGWECFDEDHEAFYTSNNSPRILEYLASLGLESCQYKTLRYQGHLEKLRVLQSLGFLSGEGNADPDLAKRLADAEVLQFDRHRDRDKVILSVQGSADGRKFVNVELVDHLDEKTRFTAMERTTSWGTTIVAYALAKGLYRPDNFATPEQFIDTKWFLEELKRRTDRLTIRETSSQPRRQS